MFYKIKISVIALCLACCITNAFAQKASDLVGTWKIDYEATKSFIPAEDRATLTEEMDNMLRGMMSGIVYKIGEDKRFEMHDANGKISPDGTKWSLKGKNIILNIPKRSSKTLKIIELSKTKVVWYDSSERGGFKTYVLVPAD